MDLNEEGGLDLSATSEDAVKWIDASNALDLLEPFLGGSAATKITLADKLLDGKLTARAGRMWESEESKLSYKNPPADPETIETNVVVDRDVWRSSRFWHDDVARWRWPENRFVITQSQRPPERTIIEGVQFLVDQITALSPLVRPDVKPSNRGRQPKMENWVSFYHAAIEIARDGKLVAGQFESQAALQEKLLDMLPEGTFGPKTIEPRVSQLWHKFMTGTD